MRSTETQSRSQSSTRSSLEIEISRLQRDLAHCEAELEDARAGLRQSEDRARKSHQEAAKSVGHSKLGREVLSREKAAENKELSDRLAAAAQLRVQLTDKLDNSNKALRDAKHDITTARGKANAADRVNASRTPPRTPPRNDNKLAERNALLHRLYIEVDAAINHDGTVCCNAFSCCR